MNVAAEALRKGIRRVVLAQGLITLSVAAVFWHVRDTREAVAACYGGATTLLISAWLGWGVQRAGAQGRALGALYVSAVGRYGGVILLLGLGLGGLKLAPLPLVCGFAAAQFGFLANIHRA